jgi:hypothetical protein
MNNDNIDNVLDKNDNINTVLDKNDNINTVLDKNDNMNLILHNETSNSKKEAWTKLGKTEKIIKLNSYIDKLSNNKKLNDTDIEQLKFYLIDSLDRKRLTSVKDVIYDKEECFIKDIPSLVFNSNTNKYTLKRNDKKNSTIKSLPSQNKPKLKKKKKNKDKN